MRKLMTISVVTFVLAAAAFALLRGDDGEPAKRPAVAAGSALDARVAALAEAARRRPNDAEPLILMASLLVDDVRQGGDAQGYPRAAAALEEAAEREPDNAAVYTERGILRLGRHDFKGGLQDGERARALAPGVVKPLGVIVDANIELGRYQEAERVLQRMVDLKPNLDSYARVAYFRELRGDLDGAAVALSLAASAGGTGAENVAFVQTLLGNIELAQNRTDRALAAYRAALEKVPAYAPADAGLARLDIAAGKLEPAIARLRKVVDRFAKQEYVTLLGELELVTGQEAAARRTLSAIPKELAALDAAGENTETEKALFEADHGDASRAVVAGRKAWAISPSVRAADALGWALTRAGQAREGLVYARRALRLGSRESSFLFHAGMAAQAVGRKDEARRHLQASLAANPAFSPLHAKTARETLAEL